VPEVARALRLERLRNDVHDVPELLRRHQRTARGAASAAQCDGCLHARGILASADSGDRRSHEGARGDARNRLVDASLLRMLARFDRDVLAQTGVRYLIVLEGINDIGVPGTDPTLSNLAVSANNIIAGYKQLIERAHAKAIRIFGGTLTPFEGADGGFYTPEGETKRQAVNKFIRTSGAFDAVIDFDLAVRDPSHPTRLAPIYDSGDHLHPNGP